MKFFNDIDAILHGNDEHKEEMAMDYIYDEIDKMMWAGDKDKNWSNVDEVLKYATEHAGDYPKSIILSILTASLPVRKSLSYNRQLIEATAKYHNMSERYKKRLFDGL